MFSFVHVRMRYEKKNSIIFRYFYAVLDLKACLSDSMLPYTPFGKKTPKSKF